MEQEARRVRVVHGMGNQPTQQPQAKRGMRGGLLLVGGIAIGLVGAYAAVQAALSIVETRRRMTETVNGGRGGGIPLDAFDDL